MLFDEHRSKTRKVKQAVTEFRLMSDSSGTYNRIYAVVREIPAGKVSTYGDVARLAGFPRQARLVGYALHSLPPHSSIPWHRVVNAKGGISTGRDRKGADSEQRIRLEDEGIEFGIDGRISMKRFRSVSDFRG